MTEHFTAWITTDTSALPNGNVDISVLADEITGYQGDDQTLVWESTGSPVFYAETDIDAQDGDQDGLDAGYVVTVARN